MKPTAPVATITGVLCVFLGLAEIGIHSARATTNPSPSTGAISNQPNPPAMFRLVFFPPTTPIYAAPIRDFSPRKMFNGRSYPPPVELADEVGEFFYPPLGSRYFEKKLDDKLREQLTAYHAKRAALLNELLNQLTVVTATDAAARESALRGFATVQTPRIVALEAEAGQLRVKFIGGGLGYNADWNHARDWNLNHLLVPAAAAAAEFQVIRATAFYQAGLSPEQRGLLLEVATERVETARPATSGREDQNVAVIFFSPATTRFQPSPALIREAGLKIATFTMLKNSLKRELVETVITEDNASAAHRTKTFTRLSESQWPELAALESLAEDIRRAEAALAPPSLPALPPQLSPALLARIDAYKRERSELQKEEFERINAIPLRPRIRPGEATTPGQVRRRIRESFEAEIAEREKVRAQFHEENASRYEALAETAQSLATEVQAVAQTMTDPKTGRPMSAPEIMQRINVADAQFEKIGREETIYKNYRTAMLEPGLSPEQRRLLFSAALAGLAQPLPPADRMPDGPIPITSY